MKADRGSAEAQRIGGRAGRPLFGRAHALSLALANARQFRSGRGLKRSCTAPLVALLDSAAEAALADRSYALRVTRVLIPIASRISWSRTTASRCVRSSRSVTLTTLRGLQGVVSVLESKDARAWGEIEAGLAAGMRLKEVWEAARKDGLDTSYAQFRVYISRLRRQRQRSIAAPLTPLVSNREAGPPDTPETDPFQNLRKQRKKTVGLRIRPFLD
jgi:hypothetical protein